MLLRYMSDKVSKGFFSDSQHKVIAAGLTMLAAVFLVATFYGLFRVLQSFVTVFSDVLMPLAIAGVLAMLLRPVVGLFENRLKLGRVSSIAALYFCIVLVVAGFLWMALPPLIGQGVDLIKSVPAFTQDASDYMQNKFPELVETLKQEVGEEKYNEYMNSLTGSVKSFLGASMSSLGKAASGILSLFGTLAAYAVVPVYLFFLLDSHRNYGSDLKKELTFLDKEWREDIVFLAEQFVDILVAFFRGQIVIGMILAVFLATGFSLVGLKFGLLLGVIIGLLNIVPYLGTIIGITIVLPLAYFQDGGGFSLIGLCALVFVASQLFGDYVLTPRIMGKQTGMNPMLIIFSIFFWGTALGGILGMILAIPLTAFFLVFWRLAKQKYLPRLTHQGQPT